MKYLKILLAFGRFNLMKAMEYRFNFIAWSVIGVGWAFFFILFTEIIFGQINSIAGWTKNEVLILTATETLFVGLMWFFIFPNLNNFSELIRKGNLDFYLTKPLNSRFLISTKLFEFDPFFRFVAVLVFIILLISRNQIFVSPQSILAYWFLLFCGLGVFYNLYFCITILSFWFVNMINLEDFFHNLLDAGRFPTQVYKGFLGILFTYLVPLSFVATFPVQALLGKLKWEIYLLTIFLVAITSILSQWFWHFALRHYSSASS